MTRSRACSVIRAPLIVAAMALLLAGCGAQDSQSPPLDPGVVTLVPGQSAPIAGATTLRVQGGSAGSENVLVLADTATVSVSAKSAYAVAASDVGAAGAVSAPSSSLIPDATATAAPVLDISFGMRRNDASRTRLGGGFGAARAMFAARTAAPHGRFNSVAQAIPTVGDLLSVNVGSAACDTLVTRSARVVAVSARAIVLSDTLNPSGGFSTADYQRFAVRFDTLVYPLDVANFGAPADIDQNQRIILLFTAAVNELTPRNSTSYVGGFFFDRDLFPVNTTPDFTGCKGSNVGELFYLLAPDPTGQVNGNIRRTGFVDSVTTSVLAHEFQHLINASRRLYINKAASEFEVTWLNEGLSHIAEELLFYHEAGLTPGGNIDATLIRGSPVIRGAYNADMSSNTARYRLYLAAPSENSPIRSDDSLETRGATWDFLRYLADRKSGGSGSDVATWQGLVNSSTNGLANLRAVFGSDIAGFLRDWSVSHYADDLGSAVVREQTQPSWNFHSIFPALAGASNTYPLQVRSLAGSSASGTLIGGGAAYYRFSIPANATATINVTAPGPIQAVVVRVR
ncbi:MAG: hypothetical protein ABI601_03740 [bacterium]